MPTDPTTTAAVEAWQRHTRMPDQPATAAQRDDGDMKWWNPNSVVREVNRRKQAGVCPSCQHGPHRDGPCDLCGDRCRYPKTFDAALSRFADARAEFGEQFWAALERLFSRGR